MVDRLKYTARPSRRFADIQKDQPSEIIDSFLYVGGHAAILSPPLLASLGITHILNVAKGLRVDSCALATNNIRILSLPVKDKTNYPIRNHFMTAIGFIEEARRDCGCEARVLVNCKRGVSRSATIAIAYLMWLYQFTFSQAALAVINLRPCVKPNVGFMLQLQEFDAQLRGIGCGQC
jgi:protein-tyrosine phosphatase